MTRKLKEEKLREMLQETYNKWVEKYNPFMSEEGYVFYSDGEYDPLITQVFNSLYLYTGDEEDE